MKFESKYPFEQGIRKASVKQVGGNHYETDIDPIAFGEANLSSVEMNGFYKMNVIKYVARCDRKNGLEDLHKAHDYLKLLIKSYEDEQQEPEEVTSLNVLTNILIAHKSVAVPRGDIDMIRDIEGFLAENGIEYSVLENIDIIKFSI